MGKVIGIPPMVVQMVISGETSGKLEEMLTKAASYLEDEFQQTTRITLSLLEPMVVVIMGLVVGSIVLAILLPLIQMNSLSNRDLQTIFVSQLTFCSYIVHVKLQYDCQLGSDINLKSSHVVH